MTTRTRASQAPKRAVPMKSSQRTTSKANAMVERSGLAGRLGIRWRKDVKAILSAGRVSFAGIQAVLGRATVLSKEAAGEWRTAARVMAEIGPQESARLVHKLAIAAFEFALADIRELAELAASSQCEALGVVRRRIDQNVDDVRRLLRA
ncbi:phasin family protein [Piscinibacter sp. XHJ-5]|uniref:phasin family protein n=1 Tax=Piscinibacter sp. XHJ-5 TaxID=3037797 RepID=UPI002452BE94|nr:phasin family protein [Piscinibacter sp. XHJ-5]